MSVDSVFLYLFPISMIFQRVGMDYWLDRIEGGRGIHSLCPGRGGRNWFLSQNWNWLDLSYSTDAERGVYLKEISFVHLLIVWPYARMYLYIIKLKQGCYAGKYSRDRWTVGSCEQSRAVLEPLMPSLESQLKIESSLEVNLLLYHLRHFLSHPMCVQNGKNRVMVWRRAKWAKRVDESGGME